MPTPVITCTCACACDCTCLPVCLAGQCYRCSCGRNGTGLWCVLCLRIVKRIVKSLDQAFRNTPKVTQYGQ